MPKILLVDDEEIFCGLLAEMLRSHGHEVLTANGGKEALKLFREHHPQLTVLDFRMPEMDGLEVLRQIHADDPKAAVMMLTAWGSDEIEQQARQHGALDFLSKQLTYDSIVTAVESAKKDPAKLYVPGSVLLVADSDKEANLFEPFLRNKGVSLRVARGAKEALTLVSDELPELIALNTDLTTGADPTQAGPKMTAREFILALNKMRYPGKLIVMGSSADHAELAQASKLGPASHLQNPVTPYRLLVAIQFAIPNMSRTEPKPLR